MPNRASRSGRNSIVATLELQDIRKSYGAKQVLAPTSLKIADGEFLCIFGPPGCGKTVLLRLLLGLETPDSGDILIDGRSVVMLTPAQRNLAMVFQNLALFPHMNVRQNLAFPLRERRAPQDRVAERVAAVAETLHIGQLLWKLPAHLSGGERQRVALGRALIRPSNALLMDEPISALDARLREEMRVELKRLQREIGQTIVYVTHDQEEAMSVADRLCVMGDGTIKQVGTPSEIYDRPTDAYVARIVGSPPMNFISGTYDAVEGLFLSPELGFRLAIGRAESWAGGPASLGIRSEDISIEKSAAAGDSAFSATVYEVEPLGAYTIVDLAIGQSIFRAQIPGQPRFEPDQRVRFSFDLAKCHLFNGASEARVAVNDPRVPVSSAAQAARRE